MTTELNWNPDKTKILKCVNCGKAKGRHNAVTKACPVGRVTRAGQITFHCKNVWTANYAHQNATAEPANEKS